MNETTRLYTRDGFKTIEYEVHVKLQKHCEELEAKLRIAEATLVEFADYENPNDPKDICSPKSEYMKEARCVLEQMNMR